MVNIFTIDSFSQAQKVSEVRGHLFQMWLSTQVLKKGR